MNLNLPPVVKNLLIINIIIFFSQRALGGQIENIFALHQIGGGFEPYQLFTYSFLHDPRTFNHLISNMIGLFFFGRSLESIWGGKMFLTYYILTGFFAGIVQLLMGDFGITIGASGSVFGLLAAFGILFPNQYIYLLIPPIPLKAKYFVSIYALIELYLGVFPNQGDNIAHFAHLGGALSGFLILLYWRHKGKTYF